jgi:hypothetical protein
MAVPRPLLLTLLGTVLLAATFLATRNAREQAAEAPAPPAQEAAAPEQAAPEASQKAKPRADRAQGSGNSSRDAAPARERAERRGAAPEKRGADKRPTRSSTVAAVKRAISSNRTVVLFFYQRRSSDDRRVAASVNALRGTKAAVFRDRIRNLARYGQIATTVGVTRAPSIVIIGKGRSGRLIEGYVDANTLAQRVADAR